MAAVTAPLFPTATARGVHAHLKDAPELKSYDDEMDNDRGLRQPVDP